MKKVCLLALAGWFTASSLYATLLREKFATDPAQDGWQIYGDTNLFQWDSTNLVLDVTWDSTQTNSYYYHPLDRTYTEADSFCIQFDLTLADAVAVGYFELAIGLCNYAEATSATFSRANAISPDLCEFDYFPDGMASWGPSIDATLADSNDHFYFQFDATQPLPLGVNCRVVLIHPAGESSVSATVFTNGQVMTTLPNVYSEGTGDFQVDTLAVFNYTTTDDSYGDSLLAHGTVGNLAFASPLPIGLAQSIGIGQTQFTSDTNWVYTLEQSTNFQTWAAVTDVTAGNGTNLLLQATNPPAGAAFYRVRADLP